MRTRPFGPDGPEVPVVGQGTWQMDADRREDAVRALRRALDLGATHLDTAENYGWGEVESLVGEAIAGRRDEAFLVSKVDPSNASLEGTLRACEESLRRLRTDRLDCYLLHWPGPHPLEDTFEAFERLRTDGKILSWGVSNFDAEATRRALSLAPEGHLACNQVKMNLETRWAVADGTVDLCRAHRVAVVAHTPVARGRLPEGEAGRVLRAVADAHGATPRQIALAFLLADEQVFTIPKATSPEHLEENVAAGDLVLTSDELEQLERAFPAD